MGVSVRLESSDSYLVKKPQKISPCHKINTAKICQIGIKNFDFNLYINFGF